MSGKKLSDKMIKTLLAGGTTEKVKGFKKKDGTTFEAALKFDENFKMKFVLPEKKELDISCPMCGKPLKEGEKSYYCSNYSKDDSGCKFGISKEKGGVKISIAELKELLTEHQTKKSREFVSKEGKKFTAKLQLKDFKVEYLFEERMQKETALKCPACGGKIIENDKSFACEKHDYNDKSSCQFSIWKTVAGRKLKIKELNQLITFGTTDKLDGFVSSKSGKEFSAKLKLVDGKIELEFK